MKTSIIILTYNKLELTQMCIESIREYTTPGTYEIIIVDNNSTDNTVAWLQQQPDLKVIYNQENKGFPGGCNQGIEIATGDNILLLNNDVIVTKNWLDNLVTALYSADDIGAVGPSTNYCAYAQAIPTYYKDATEMHQFAAERNQSNPNLWEERLKLIGYCMLIKSSVVRQVGLLDEIFTPGNYEDDDYSFRIRDLGYRLLFCKDTFIHHFGSMSWKDDFNKFNKLLHVNEEKFFNKWGFSATQGTMIHLDLIGMTEDLGDLPCNVLEVNCGAGGTLLKIKDRYPKAHLYGIEPNEQAARFARAFGEICTDSVDSESWSYPEEFFDLIVLGNVLEFVSHPKQTLRRLLPCLKPSGTLVASVKNISHCSVLQNVIEGKPIYNQDGVRFYSHSELQELFRGAGFESVKFEPLKEPVRQADKKWIEGLNALTPAHLQNQYTVSDWLIQAKLTSPRKELFNLFQQLEQETNVSETLQRLNQLGTEKTIAAAKGLQNAVEMLNRIATLNFMHQHFEDVIPYLQAAQQLAPNDPDTLYNFGSVLYQYGEYDMALHFLKQISEPDEQTAELIHQIQGQNEQTEQLLQEIKFCLHRIEFDVEQAGAVRSLTDALSAQQTTVDQMVARVKVDNIDQAKVLNAIAVAAYEQGLYEHVLPFLQAAYDFNPRHTHTLYNLGSVLHSLGERQMALQFLKQVSERSEEVVALLAQIEKDEMTEP